MTTPSYFTQLVQHTFQLVPLLTHSPAVCLQVVRAEDEGGLSNTATVNIVVSDINDKNPEFVDLPYEFAVREGEAGSLVGTVRAVDADEGTNALVTYSLPSDVPFAINSTSGVITTSTALDYETQKVSHGVPENLFCKLNAAHKM